MVAADHAFSWSYPFFDAGAHQPPEARWLPVIRVDALAVAEMDRCFLYGALGQLWEPVFSTQIERSQEIAKQVVKTAELTAAQAVVINHNQQPPEVVEAAQAAVFGTVYDPNYAAGDEHKAVRIEYAAFYDQFTNAASDGGGG